MGSSRHLFLCCVEQSLHRDDEVDEAVLRQFRGHVPVVDESRPDGNAPRKFEGGDGPAEWAKMTSGKSGGYL